MGHDVYRDVLDNAPADLGPAERMILLVLADLADESTRQCSWPIDVIEHQTGLSADALRKAFQRLGRRGLDPRVRIGTDRRGNAVFAYEGKSLTYRVPRFDQRPTPYARTPGGGIKRRDDRPTTDHMRGGTTVPQRWDDGPSEVGPSSPRGGTTVPPNPCSQDPNFPSGARFAPLVELGATPDEERRIIEEIQSKAARPIGRMGGYLEALHRDGKVAPILEAIRAPERDRLANERARIDRALPMCHHDGPPGTLANGAPRCPQCRAESTAPVIDLDARRVAMAG